MKCIYVAGPYRAPTSEGVRCNIESVSAFARWLAELTWQSGVVYIVPHVLTTSIDSGQPDEYWLAATMEKLRRCDAIVMFAGFERSAGSMTELAEAQRLGLRVFYHSDARLLDEIREWGQQ